jgi:mRNA interferase RelE/StbE
MWKIRYLRSARKDAKKIDPHIREKIRGYLEQRVASLDDPRQLGEPLKGQLAKLWRYRIGDYRIICEFRNNELIVIVIRIGHRRNVYK